MDGVFARQTTDELELGIEFVFLDFGFGFDLVTELALADFFQGDVGEIHARIGLRQRAVPLSELADPTGDKVDEKFRVGNLLLSGG